MKKPFFVKFLLLLCAVVLFSFQTFAQAEKNKQIKSQEVSEVDGIPVLLKHLPDYENVRNSAVLAHNVEDLRKTLGERPIYDLIDFTGGTEAATANYAQGKVLIVEHTTPQISAEMDAKVQQRLSETGQNPPIFYRRIGNYNAFVFDAPDESAANALLDQIKYEKQVQWLGDNPFELRRAEQAIVQTLSSMFVATVIFIFFGILTAVLTGIAIGYVYFRFSEKKRTRRHEFSDAGGMTRLNLDELT